MAFDEGSLPEFQNVVLETSNYFWFLEHLYRRFLTVVLYESFLHYDDVKQYVLIVLWILYFDHVLN